MNLHEPAIKLRQIASDILTVAESLSPIRDGCLSHDDAISVAAVVAKCVLTALVENNPNGDMMQYRNAFVAKLDAICGVGG